MAKQYQVVGPYVAQVPVNGPQGTILTDFNQGAILPSDVPKERIEHLLDVGLIEEVGAAEETTEAEAEAGPPARSASKAEWVDYAVSQGMSREDAEKASKDDLVAAFGAS